MIVNAPELPEPEDYCMKLAREGRAIFVPGKSVNETRASLGFPPLADDPVVAPSELISHTETELGKIADIANKVQYIIGTLSQTINLLRKGIGDSLTANEVDAVLQLAESFATGATDNECNTLLDKIMSLERVIRGANQ